MTGRNQYGTNPESIWHGDFRLPGQPHRQRHGAAHRRHHGHRRRALGGLHRQVRGHRAAGRRPAPLRRQGRAESRAQRVGNHLPGAGEGAQPDGAGNRPRAVQAGRHPQQGPPGGQRHAGCVHGGGPGHRRPLPHAPVPVFGRGRGLPAAPAHDEHFKRRRPRREQHRHPGVYDSSHGGAQLPGGAAVVRGNHPHLGPAAESPGALHRRGGRGRLCPRFGKRRGRH